MVKHEHPYVPGDGKTGKSEGEGEGEERAQGVSVRASADASVTCARRPYLARTYAFLLTDTTTILGVLPSFIANPCLQSSLFLSTLMRSTPDRRRTLLSNEQITYVLSVLTFGRGAALEVE